LQNQHPGTAYQVSLSESQKDTPNKSKEKAGQISLHSLGVTNHQY